MLYDEVTLEEITLLGEVMAAAAEQRLLTPSDLDRVLLAAGATTRSRDERYLPCRAAPAAGDCPACPMRWRTSRSG